MLTHSSLLCSAAHHFYLLISSNVLQHLLVWFFFLYIKKKKSIFDKLFTLYLFINLYLQEDIMHHAKNIKIIVLNLLTYHVVQYIIKL